MPDKISVAELERAEREATPGPWSHWECGDSCKCVRLQCGDRDLLEYAKAHDLHAIALARNALPALLEMARAADEARRMEYVAQGEIDRLNTALAKLDFGEPDEETGQ